MVIACRYFIHRRLVLISIIRCQGRCLGCHRQRTQKEAQPAPNHAFVTHANVETRHYDPVVDRAPSLPTSG